MFAAIRKAKDHINVESYIIDDDDVGRQFSGLQLESWDGRALLPRIREWTARLWWRLL